MVQHVSVGVPLLRCPTDLPVGGRDVVERHVVRFHPHPLQSLQHPLVQELIGILKRHSVHQGRGNHQRIGDAVPRFHKHGAAPRHPPRHGDAVLGDALWVNLILITLE